MEIKIERLEKFVADVSKLRRIKELIRLKKEELDRIENEIDSEIEVGIKNINGVVDGSHTVNTDFYNLSDP